MPQPMHQLSFAEPARASPRAEETIEFGRHPRGGDSPALALQRELHARYGAAPAPEPRAGVPVGVRLATIAGVSAALWTLIGTGAWLALA